MDTSNGSEYDCVACGRCCYHDKPDYALLYPEDLVAFRRAGLMGLTAIPPRTAAARRHGESAPEVYMRMERGHCCALSIVPGGGYWCSIYEQRPLLCRVFEPGSVDCLEARSRPTQEVSAESDDA